MIDETKKTAAFTPESLRRLIILLGVILVLGIALYGVWKHVSTRVTDVYFVNGLDVPIVVTLGDRAVKVKPQEARRELNVPRGQYTVVATTESGAAADQFTVVIPRRRDLVVINPLGAAPMYAEELVYYADGRVPPDAAHDTPMIVHYYGARFVARDNVAFPFRAPTAHIAMSRSAAKRKVWAFGLEAGGWRATVNQLIARNRIFEAGEIASNVSMVTPDADEAIVIAMGVRAQTLGIPSAIEWCQSVTQKFPDSVEAHRGLQIYMQLAGRTEECRATYRALAEKNPDSPMHAYLRARLEPPDEALALFAQLVEKFPNYAYGRRSYGWHLYQKRRFAQAIEQWNASRALEPLRHMEMFFNHLRALAAIGRADEAARMLADFAEQPGASANFNATVFYARLLRLAGETQPRRTPEFFLQQEFGEKVPRDVLAWMAVLLGDSEVAEERLAELGNSPLRIAADITLAVRRDADLALKLTEKATPEVWQHIEEPYALLIICEFATRGEKGKAAALMDRLRRTLAGDIALRKFIFDNVETEPLAELDLDTQAVLNFTRGRRAQLKGESPDKFFEQARKDDILGTLIPHVLKNWKPAPKPKEDGTPAGRP
jgi:tetratricopeptide (TPR) repeat protein